MACVTTRDAGTCTSEDNIPVPIQIAPILVRNVPMPAWVLPEQQLPQQQPQQLQQPLQQLPQQQLPPQQPPLQPNERSIIMGMYRSLKHLDRLIKKLQEDTKRHLREALPRTVKINAAGMMKYVAPAVVALYVVNTTETKKCTHCNRLTESVCGTCHQASYCSGYCLQKDWDRHEPRCNLIVAATAQAATEALMRA